MTNGNLIPKFAAAMIVISTVGISIRFWSRGLAQKGRYSPDDWLALAAWVFGVISPILNLTHNPDPVKQLQVTFANDLLFHLGVIMAKLSALGFYHKVFADSSKSFDIALKVTAVLSILYLFYAIPTIIWSCTPVDKFWYTDKPGHCISYYAQSLTVSIWDCTLDLVILLLPMHRVCKLNMSVGRRAATAIAFFCGYCALVVSIGHMVSSCRFTNPDSSTFVKDGVELGIWSEIEVPITVFSICLPSWFWLIKRAQKYGFRAIFTSRDLSFVEPRSSRNRGYRSDTYQLQSGDSTGFGSVKGQRSRAFSPVDHENLVVDPTGKAYPCHFVDVERGIIQLDDYDPSGYRSPKRLDSLAE